MHATADINIQIGALVAEKKQWCFLTLSKKLYIRQKKLGTTQHSHGKSMRKKNAAINWKGAPNTNKPFIT